MIEELKSAVEQHKAEMNDVRTQVIIKSC